MISPKYLKFCLILLMFEVIILVVFATPNYLAKVMAIEGVNFEDLAGTQALQTVDRLCSTFFYTSLVDSGAYSGVWHLFIPTEDERLMSEGLEKLGSGIFSYLEDKFVVIAFLIFQLIHRVLCFSVWLPSTAIIGIGATYSGLMLRKLKRENFAFASPTMHRASIKIIISFLPIIPILLISPFPITPYIYPTLIFIASFMVMGILANIAKRV